MVVRSGSLMVLALLSASLAGCASVPGVDEDTQSLDTSVEASSLGAFSLTMSFENATGVVGLPFNITLAGVLDAMDDGADAMEDDSTADGNATADGNSTADGNATADSESSGAASPLASATWTVDVYNVTAGDNGTVRDAVALLHFEGTGLPASLAPVFEGNGSYVAVATAGLEGYENATVELPLDILALVAGESDPCAGVPAQEPITITGTFVGAAVDGTGTYEANPFELAPCQKKIFAEITTDPAYVDSMLRLKDNTGAEVDAEDNDFEFHDSLTYEPGGYLEPGTWQIDARGYLAGPGDYTIVLTFS